MKAGDKVINTMRGKPGVIVDCPLLPSVCTVDYGKGPEVTTKSFLELVEPKRRALMTPEEKAAAKSNRDKSARERAKEKGCTLFEKPKKTRNSPYDFDNLVDTPEHKFFIEYARSASNGEFGIYVYAPFEEDKHNEVVTELANLMGSTPERAMQYVRTGKPRDEKLSGESTHSGTYNLALPNPTDGSLDGFDEKLGLYFNHYGKYEEIQIAKQDLIRYMIKTEGFVPIEANKGQTCGG